MSATPFLGDIVMFAGTFAPQGWAFCDGQLLAIAQNQALFSLLGTTYGGDGQSTFGLPDLRARVPLGLGNAPALTNRPQGATGGASVVTLSLSEIPAHTHDLRVHTTPASQTSPAGASPARVRGALYAAAGGTDATMSSSSFAAATAHENLPPYQVVNFIIAVQGIFPSFS